VEYEASAEKDALGLFSHCRGLLTPNRGDSFVGSSAEAVRSESMVQKWAERAQTVAKAFILSSIGDFTEP
jgi:hypothetical protein